MIVYLFSHQTFNRFHDINKDYGPCEIKKEMIEKMVEKNPKERTTLEEVIKHLKRDYWSTPSVICYI